MARTYIDLLTFPMNAGGSDTPSRLTWIATELGYEALGVFAPAWAGRNQQFPDIETQVVTVRDDKVRGPRRGEIKVGRGTRARKAASSRSADFIIPDPRDRVALRFAAENDVPVAYPYSSLLLEHSTRRSRLIRAWSLMHTHARKLGCQELLVSGARDSYLLRDPRDLASLVSVCMGTTAEEALDWVSTTPQKVLAKAKERGGG
jgi:hypothetical protein